MLRSDNFNLLRDLPQAVGGNILYLILPVDRQPPDFIVLFLEIVSDPHAATLTLAGHGPAQFSDSTGAGHDIAGRGIFEHAALQPDLLVIRQIGANQLGKDGSFDKLHGSIIRQRRIAV